MKKKLVIIVLLVASLSLVLLAVTFIVNPASKTQKEPSRAKKQQNKNPIGSLESSPKRAKFNPDWRPMSDADRERANASVIPFPQTLAGAGPPYVGGSWGGDGDPAIARFAQLELVYPNDFYLIREYRHPADLTIPSEEHNKLKIENMRKEHATFYGGVIYQRVDIGGHDALLRPRIEESDTAPAVGVTISWYAQPFKYVLFGPVDMPMEKVIAAAKEITDFANKNVPPSLPPYAANTPSGFLFPGETTGTPPEILPTAPAGTPGNILIPIEE